MASRKEPEKASAALRIPLSILVTAPLRYVKKRALE
jgi:hypothetical protein